MPYKSLKQERFFHTDTARKKGIKQSTVDEFDKASKGLKLPTVASSPKDPTPEPFNPIRKSNWAARQ